MENSSQYTDEELVKLFCAGHTSAGEELIRRYEPLVDHLCSPAFVRTFSEDLKQSLWVRFLEGVRAYDEQKGIRFSGYMKSLLTYERWNRFKSLSRKWDHESDYPECSDILSYSEDPAALTESALLKSVRELPLPRLQKDILLLLARGYRTSAEIARCLRISPQSVHTARRRLRQNCLRLKESGIFF